MTLTFEYTATEGHTISIRWYRSGVALYDGTYDGVVISGATTTTLTILNPTADYDGEYYAIISDETALCEVQTDSVDVYIPGLCRLIISGQPESDILLYGNDLELSVAISDEVGPATYQWYLDGVELVDGASGGATIAGATTATLTITNIEAGGEFTVIVVDTGIADCSVGSTAATITVRVLGPGFVPAFSTDSDVVCAGFAEYPASGTGSILTRRTPNGAAGDSTPNFDTGIDGGAAWYPDGNRFYHGADQSGASDGLVLIVDPTGDTVTYINVPGADGLSGKRAFYYASIDEVWVQVDTGNMFLRIDPTDNTVIGYVVGATLIDFDYCASNDCLYGTDGSNVYKITSAGVVSTVFQAATIGVGYAIGTLAYVTSLDRVIYTVYKSAAAYFVAWQLDPATDLSTSYVAGVGGSVMYYSETFDRIILQGTSDGTPSGLPTILGSYTTAFVFVRALVYSGGASDTAYAKGCYVSSTNTEALGVLQGAGSRFYDLAFYDGTNLT